MSQLDKINARVKELATKIEEAISFDDDGAAVLPETFVKDNLPEELSLETIKAVQDEESFLASALPLALGNTALPAMKADKSVLRLTAQVNYGNNVLKAGIDRKQMTRNPATGEEREKFGSTQVKLESGAAAKRGDLKKILTHVAEKFAEASGDL